MEGKERSKTKREESRPGRAGLNREPAGEHERHSAGAPSVGRLGEGFELGPEEDVLLAPVLAEDGQVRGLVGGVSHHGFGQGVDRGNLPGTL